MSLRVACLGAGYFARFHHEAWARIPRARTGRRRRSGYCPRRRPRGQPAYPDLAAHAGGDTPRYPRHHRAARRPIWMLSGRRWPPGSKAIICQKPFCTSLAEADTGRRPCRRCRYPVDRAREFPVSSRGIARSRPQIAAGRLGESMQASVPAASRRRAGAARLSGPAALFPDHAALLVHETGVHWIDTFRFLLGPITAVYADLRHLNPAIAGEDAGDHPVRPCPRRAVAFRRQPAS